MQAPCWGRGEVPKHRLRTEASQRSAESGILWDVLACSAQMLFASAGNSAAPSKRAAASRSTWACGQVFNVELNPAELAGPCCATLTDCCPPPSPMAFWPPLLPSTCHLWPGDRGSAPPSAGVTACLTHIQVDLHASPSLTAEALQRVTSITNMHAELTCC